MLGKPIASGLMLTTLIVVGGGAMLQGEGEADAARVAPDAPERSASAPDRVVESAGFPAVPESENEAEPETPRPIVTVNGRPLDGAVENGAAASAPDVVADTPQDEGNAEAAGPAEQAVAVAEPPRPIPRPQGLVAPQAQPVDYEAIAAIAYGEDAGVPATGEFMSVEQRLALEAGSGQGGLAPDDPRRQGLVAVVGPDGEPIWIYEEQLRGDAATNSGVTFSTRRVQSNPYGFIYDEYGW